MELSLTVELLILFLFNFQRKSIASILSSHLLQAPVKLSLQMIETDHEDLIGNFRKFKDFLPSGTLLPYCKPL